MKTLFTFLILFLVFETNAQSVYHPFPDSAIVWRGDLGGLGFACCCQGVCLHAEHYQHFFNGDTIIGSYSYKKIFKTGNMEDYITGPPGCPPGCSSYVQTFFSDVYVGGLRQDTALRKVYFADPLSGYDTLLYDFNLNAGDTLPGAYNNWSVSNYVLSIDSIFIGNEFHKRFNIAMLGNTSSHVSIIEGIGSTYGLIYSLVIPFEIGNSLQCVTINDVPVYPDTNSICILDAGIDENSLSNVISVSPNPISSSAVVSIHEDFNEVELKIYNSFGSIVRQEKIEGNSFLIKRNGLSPGIYFLKISDKNGRSAISKLVVE